MRLFCFLFSLGIAAAAVESPSIGYVRAADGSIVRVAGVSGAFVTTAAEQPQAVSAGFSGSLGFIKLDASVRVLNGAGELLGEYDAPAGPALFGFNAKGDAGVAYYPATQTLALFRDGVWTRVPYEGGAIAVGLKDADTALIAAPGREPTLLTIRLSDGATQSRDPLSRERSQTVLITADGTLLFARGDALVYREQVIAAGARISAISQMGAGWVHIQTDSGRNLALRLDPQPLLYELPEVSQ